MPERHIQSDPALESLLEEVRERQGLQTADEALEWLVKSRLARIARPEAGNARARRRALHLVSKGGQQA